MYKKDPLYQPGTIVKLEGENRAYMIVGNRKISPGDESWDYAAMDFPGGVDESKITDDSFRYFDHMDIEIVHTHYSDITEMVNKHLGIVNPMKDPKKRASFYIPELFKNLKGDDTQ